MPKRIRTKYMRTETWPNCIVVLSPFVDQLRPWSDWPSCDKKALCMCTGWPGPWLLANALTLSTLGKISTRWHTEIFFLFFRENRKNITDLSSAELAQRVVKVDAYIKQFVKNQWIRYCHQTTTPALFDFKLPYLSLVLGYLTFLP